MLAHLDHANLPKVMDYFTENGKHYIVMEFVEGETLDSYLERQRAGEAQVRMWAAQLFDVLGYLHRQQPPVIFRDLKPANIMLTPQGQLKLIDFGIARFFKPGKPGDTVSMGTPGYAAPEQHGRDQTDARSDIYSLGVVLHQALTGHNPSLDPFNFPSVRRLNPSVSPQMEQAIVKAIEMNRLNRFQSVDQFRAALAAGVTAPYAQTVKTGPLSGHAGKLAIGVAGVAVLILLAFVGGWTRFGDPPTTRTPIVEPSGLRISIDNAARLTLIKQFAADADDLAWTPDSEHLLLAASSGVIMLDIGEETQTHVITSTSPSLFDVSTDGERLVTADRQGIRVWSLMNEQATLDLEMLTSPVTDVSFGSQNRDVGWLESDGLIRIMNTEDETVRVLSESDRAFNKTIAFSSANPLVASSGTDHIVKLWNLVDVDYPTALESRSSVARLEFAPDVSSLVSANEDGTILLWELEDLANPRIFLGHLAAVTNVSFSPDGRLLASASRDDTVRLWDLDSGRELRILKGHTADVTFVAFSPDGRWIASFGEDNTLRLWGVR